MTPQMPHATLATGQITIWEDRLDVTPKRCSRCSTGCSGRKAAGL